MHPIPPHRPLPDRNAQLPYSSTHLGLNARLAVTNDQQLDLFLRLGYDADDPFTIILEFRMPSAPAVTWRISRDLLWEGLRQPTGEGDVRIWPPCPCHNRPMLRIVLRGSDATAIVDVSAEPVDSWLSSQVFELVPRGSEADLIDWDAELERLLQGL